jgi:formiminoglutamase
MSAASSSEAAWSTRLEPVALPDDLPRRPDDPRLGEVTEFWAGDPAALRPGRPVLIGFPQDEGVHRNGGRVGAADAPVEIRRWLYRLVPYDCEAHTDLGALALVDLGNIRITGSLEETQTALGQVVAATLRCGAIPVVLGGGHETAYGHYLGYVAAGRPVGVVNLDAHLDVRPLLDGQGHSGSPFRQMMEHAADPLPGERYICLGAQPQCVARSHLLYARQQGADVRWAGQVRAALVEEFRRCVRKAAGSDCQVYVSLDADAVHVSDVPGVSAPNVAGVAGDQVVACARIAGASPQVASFELVEINPRHDRNGQSARWAALAVWSFLAGLAERRSCK